MNNIAAQKLAVRLTGDIPSPRSSALKGIMTGTMLFLFFEYASVFNSNIPRIPVAWLMIAASVMMESVLFFRIVRLLSQPRKPDLFFIMRLGYDQRTHIARKALQSGHRSFLPFLAAVLTVAALGELFLVHEKSVILLVVIPVACVLVLLLTEMLMTALISRHAIPCTRKDDIGEEGSTAKGSHLRQQLAGSSVFIAKSFAGRFPQGIRIVLMRNLLYFLRGEVIITSLIALAAPVITAILIIMLKNPLSPFATFLPLLFIFMSNFHYSSELAEAAEALPGCHWYRFTPRQLLAGTFATLALPALLPIATFIVFSFQTLITPAGGVRLVNFIFAAAVIVFIASRMQLSSRHGDSDPAIGMALFGIIGVGNFIPVAGGLFTLVAGAVALILDRKSIFGKE